MIPIRKLAAPALAAAAAALAFATAPAASAVTGQLTLPVAYPQGVAMDALNWAGTGAAASCASGTAATNAFIGVWKSTGAGCASLFKAVQISVGGAPITATSPFEIVYAPGGAPATHEAGSAIPVPDGFCVSTYANSAGTFARLRHCAATLSLSTGGVYTASEATANAWQTFAALGGTVDDPGAVQIENAVDPQHLCLNDQGFGGNGSHVISWTCSPPRANEAWNVPSAG